MVGRGEGKLVTETGSVGTAGAAQPSGWSGVLPSPSAMLGLSGYAGG